jgi:hypothetical protein
VVFAFYFLNLLTAVLMGGVPPDMSKAVAALASVYGLAFIALVAGYFWARWYSVGVGLFGILVATVAMWKEGVDTVPLFLGGTHLLATLSLWGDAMSGPYDGQKAWREKFHMDDHAVQRLGRSVIRAGMSLPLILLYAFAPKQPASMLASLVALALAGLGVRAIVRLKTWGVMALAAAGTMLIALSTTDGSVRIASHGIDIGYAPVAAGLLLLAAAAPFAAPIARFFGKRSA